MRKLILKSILTLVLGGAILALSITSNAQIFPTSTVLLTNNTIKNHTINSVEDYVQLEHSVSMLSARISEAYQQFPNMQYVPVFDDENAIGFIITGVSNPKDANEISYALMQLEAIGEMISNVDVKYLPVSAGSKSARVSKKVANK
ncbi:MAG: hypothetical protein ABI477_23740 [Chryseolinea sp.]